MKNKVWNLPTPVAIPEGLTRAGYTPLLAAVLAARGFKTAEEVAVLLDDGPWEPGDPMLMTDMERAVRRIRLARERGELVAVYGDYDVDGITASCLLAEYLQSMGLETEIYIPNRLEEGYGVNDGAIRKLHDRGVSLVVTVDCGVTAVEQTALAADLGMDIIVTDHHECQEKLPEAVAVVDPKRPDCVYPDRELAGVGVAFKLVCALDGDGMAMLGRYADLVALGTIADVMPLIGENRRMVRAGLEKLRSNPSPGLDALMALSGVEKGRISATAVGFTLAPRINAAGRLGHTSLALRLLLEKNSSRALNLAGELCGMNHQRQQMEADIWDETSRMMAGKTPTGPIVLAGEGWHPGIIGIAAARLSEAYSVPTVMISLDGEMGKGSCRSFGDFNLFDALAYCNSLLDAFGGHALAAGLNIHRANIDAFRKALQEYYVNHPPHEDEGLALDLEITDPALLTLESVDGLQALEPFGNGNPRPNLCMLDCCLNSAVPIGGGKHVRLRLEKFGQSYDCVWFSHRIEQLNARRGDRVDAAFYPQVSEFRGRRTVQLVLLDLRRTDTPALCRRALAGQPGTGQGLTRVELGRLWRSLARRSPVHLGVSGLGRIEPGLNPVQIALGLRVLSELGLAAVQTDGQEIDVTLITREGKADLMQSVTWRRYHR
ncbi:MAG: single-stranded-DNA-specific exonuclease RecJ [Oscillospiraceae bacterium]|nr:single-stranded-DNA-specific exonuclease RecJ [Oscillospiraceae bacterium]